MGADTLFAGPGEVRALCRAMDWSRTAAGAVESWAPSLRMAVRMCLDAPLAMAVWAIPGLGLIYNDGYAALLGPAQHPAALGRSAREVWAGQWRWLEPDLEQVIQRGEAAGQPQLRLLLKRDGVTEEEVFLSYGLMPIRDDDGRVVAAFNVMADITERVRAFAQRTALLEAVIRSSQDAIFAKDLRGRMLLANPTMVAFLGKRAEQILGKSDFEFLDDKAQARETMANDRRVFETGEPIEAEEVVSSADGTPAIWHAAKALVRDASGRAIGLLGISRNITEHKRDDEALRAALESAELERRRSAAVLGALAAGIAITDRSGKIVQTNAALARIWGCPLDSRCFCCSDEPWKGRWVETGKPLAPDDWALARTLRSGEVVTTDRVEIDKLDGTGSATIMEAAAPIRDSDDRIVGAVVAILDVTDRRRAEEAVLASETRLREAQRLSRMGSWEWIVGDASPSWSEGLFLILGRDLRAGPPSIQTLPQVFTPEAWSRLGPAIQRAAETGEPYELETEMVRPDGTRFWAITRGEAVRGPTGAVVKLHGTSQDITERKRAEQERERLLAALREADQRKDEFLGMLSHELRNPLTPICNSLDVLNRTTPGGEQDRRARVVIDRQVHQLTRLVDDLLDVTRITRGKIRLQKARLDFVALVRQTVEDHRSLLEGRDVAVELPAGALWVVGDRARLAQAIGNLLQNAAKFTPRGRKVSISLVRADSSAVVEVADTGMGIELDLLPRLFQPFTQGERSLARTGGGLGLGLSLVKGLVEQHGGKVTATSEGPGRGARFTLTLPVDERPAPAPPLAPAQPVIGRGLKVLLIEDNVDAADSLAALLDFDGYEVMVSYAAKDGIAKARAFKPDVLLCDVGLPDMSGYDVARVFRDDASLKDVLLVALTGYAGPEDQHRAAESGFNRHFPKPPDLPALEDLLGAAAARLDRGTPSADPSRALAHSARS
jgi:PAS domain S-box-containing protein